MVADGQLPSPNSNGLRSLAARLMGGWRQGNSDVPARWTDEDEDGVGAGWDGVGRGVGRERSGCVKDEMRVEERKRRSRVQDGLYLR